MSQGKESSKETLNWMAVSWICFETKICWSCPWEGKQACYWLSDTVSVGIGIDDIRNYFWAKPFVICNDLCAHKHISNKHETEKSLTSQEKNALFEVCNFSRLVRVRAASRSDWNEPLETDLFHSFGCHQPSSSEDFPLFLGTARWEAARWSCCWHNLRNGQQPSTKFFKSLMIILAARKELIWYELWREICLIVWAAPSN